MISLNSHNAEYLGLSTDTKPECVSPNALFLELDTGDFYYFCKIFLYNSKIFSLERLRFSNLDIP